MSRVPDNPVKAGSLGNDPAVRGESDGLLAAANTVADAVKRVPQT